MISEQKFRHYSTCWICWLGLECLFFKLYIFKAPSYFFFLVPLRIPNESNHHVLGIMLPVEFWVCSELFWLYQVTFISTVGIQSESSVTYRIPKKVSFHKTFQRVWLKKIGYNSLLKSFSDSPHHSLWCLPLHAGLSPDISLQFPVAPLYEGFFFFF